MLEGVTRGVAIRLLRERGVEVVEERFTRDEIYIADEAFFTGTAAEITPIRSLDDRVVGPGRPGPITQRRASRLSRRDPRRAHRSAFLAHLRLKGRDRRMAKSPQRFRFGPPQGMSVSIGPPGPVPPVVRALIAVNLGVFVVTQLFGADCVIDALALVPPKVVGGCPNRGS